MDQKLLTRNAKRGDKSVIHPCKAEIDGGRIAQIACGAVINSRKKYCRHSFHKDPIDKSSLGTQYVWSCVVIFTPRPNFQGVLTCRGSKSQSRVFLQKSWGIDVS